MLLTKTDSIYNENAIILCKIILKVSQIFLLEERSLANVKFMVIVMIKQDIFIFKSNPQRFSFI